MIAGELHLRVGRGPQGVRSVECLSTRPRLSQALLQGLAPQAAAERLGRLYVVCGRAQATACASACEAAAGEEPSPLGAQRRDAALATELALEHLWHFLIDLPRASRREPAAAAMAAARARPDAAGIDAVARADVFGIPPAEFAALADGEALERWSRRSPTLAAAHLARVLAEAPSLGASAVALMPSSEQAFADGVYAGLEASRDFAAAPHWSDGEARETGALPRKSTSPLVAHAVLRWGHGVAARHVARLLELAEVLAELASGSPRPRHGATNGTPAVGYAWAQTARGLLVHRAQLEDGRIARYEIVAPTEWNFHPRGPFVAGACAIAAREPARILAEARAVAASLDPCVAWEVELADA